MQYFSKRIIDVTMVGGGDYTLPGGVSLPQSGELFMDEHYLKQIISTVQWCERGKHNVPGWHRSLKMSNFR